MAPIARDVKVFVPSRDFELSLAFYDALGWKRNWRRDGLAELEIGDTRFYLQDFYAKDWAENFMLYVVVDSADAWYDHADDVIRSGNFAPARLRKPTDEDYGARVTYVWDPSGVLIHFAEPRQ